MIKLAIVDDQELITEGLKRILSTYDDIRVVATGKNGEEALEICRAYDLDVLLMDIRMPKMNGVEGIRLIKQEEHDVKVIMLTTFEDEEYIYYVKAVPKMKVAQAERSVTALGFEEDNAGADEEVIEKPEESVEAQDISAGKEELLPRGEKED